MKRYLRLLTEVLVVFLCIPTLLLTVMESSACAEISYVGDIGTATIKVVGSTLTITTTADVEAGDAIIIAYGTAPNQYLELAINDTAGNTYTQAAIARNFGYGRTYIFAAYDVNELPSGSTITIVGSDPQGGTLPDAKAAVASVFRGLASTGALDQSLGNPTFDSEQALDASTNPSVGPVTTTQADELLIGAVGTEGPAGDAAGTWQNSFIAGQRTGTTGGTATDNWTISMGYRIVTATGAYTAAKTGITSRRWAATIATFKAETVNTCDGDFDIDGDVDGTDLADLVANPALLDAADFAVNFGNECP